MLAVRIARWAVTSAGLDPDARVPMSELARRWSVRVLPPRSGCYFATASTLGAVDIDADALAQREAMAQRIAAVVLDAMGESAARGVTTEDVARALLSLGASRLRAL